MEIPTNTVLSMMGAILTVLVAVIKVLWGRYTKLNDDQLKMSKDLGVVQGKQDGITKMAQDVLSQIDKSARKKCEICIEEARE